MSKKNYWNMKDVELKDLVINLNMEIDTEDWNRKEAIEALKLKDMATGEATEVLVQDETGVTEAVVDPNAGKIQVVKVRFHSTRESEAPYIFLGLNGKSYYVPREQDIYIPKELLDSCIKDAVEEHLIPERRTDGKINYITKKVQRFPYTELHD